MNFEAAIQLTIEFVQTKKEEPHQAELGYSGV
jgi:hypothetical protein